MRYGLSGGIASGKSTVAAMLRECGFPVLEADRIARELIEPGGAAHEEVVKRFGTGMVAPGGRIDRQRLAALVFPDRSKLDELNSIVHPRVEEQIERDLAALESGGGHQAAFVEAALIFEAGLHRKLDGVVVVWCLPEQQVARLKDRGMSEAEAKQRIAMQMPVEEKLARATERVDCSGSLAETRKQVAALAERLRRASAAV